MHKALSNIGKFFIALLLLAGPLSSLTLSREIFSDAPFIPHTEKTKFGSYLAKNITYQPVQKLKKEIEGAYGLTLLDRGEAHITVVTPIEYEKIQAILDISEINQLAQNIQSFAFQVLCVGKGEVELDGTKEKTLFVVVESENLKNLRRAIKQRYLEKGGETSKFDAEDFYPHITVGYTKRDLHASDGVFKDQRTCFDYPTIVP